MVGLQDAEPAKDACVSADGTGSHRLVIASETGPFTDPDGFTWEAVPQSAGRPQPLPTTASGSN